ncbi:MAG TPA: hypothetical protein VN577_00785 [Terriglobales bacterium]|nr:hypothetical protein [Terriglobales bacterium]
MIVQLSNDDYQELFALFTSTTREELEQIYMANSQDYFRNEKVLEEYELTQEKGEFALDAWRAVMYFLHRHGFVLSKDGQVVDLEQSSGYDR